ncbi:MAG: lipid A biosynthesis lauroyl acyltransferase [Candidatus Campylobacter infans]|nr:MAG: lipid A biosynthesis lauroyl acyltransferase [Candidatus Campylobacter infans]
MLDFLYLSLYYFLKFLIFIIPKPALNALLNALSALFYKFDKKHTKIMLANLKMCGYDEQEAKKIIKSCYKNFAYFGLSFLKNQGASKEQILNQVRFENAQMVKDALNSGKALIFQTAHYGNWELMSIACAAYFGVSISVVGRNLDNVKMNKILSKNRTRFNIELIPKSGAARGVLNALKNGRVVGMLVDQNTAAKDGIECKFFGKKILHTPAASIFAQKLNALIVPTFVHQDGDISVISFYEPISLDALGKDSIQIATQLQSDATERVIRKKPDEYFWMHKKFKHFYESIYE